MCTWKWSSRRFFIGLLTALMTAAATWLYGRTILQAGWGILSVLILASLRRSSSGSRCRSGWRPRGSYAACANAPMRPPPHRLDLFVPDDSARTAILMPIYNEDPERVLAGLRATYESVAATGHAAAFDFFLLSDTTDPDLWLAEELGWSQLTQSLPGPSRVFYRHRPKNTCRKSGNIADFCERWGTDYRYMIVLDADSVMSGATMVEMVRRMEEDPQMGILQVPPVPVNRVSLFARCQQFAARVYGPIFLEGYAWWSQIDGNYWGHNAIIRIEPFTHHCGLPTLPGPPPLGGEILSHDFVEAALMRRAGLKVCLAHDLDGSYEECPPTLIDYAQRDQRWCQGNMQHIRLVFSYGLLPMSRLHLGMGSMAYLTSPLWLMFILLSSLWEPTPTDAAAEADTWWRNAYLFIATMVLMLLPKCFGYLVLLRDPAQRARCGGAWRAFASVLIETLISILVAPIMMAFHVVFVFSTLLGVHVGWSAQQRSEQGQALLPAIVAHWKQTVAGILALAAAWFLMPLSLPWLAPVFVGLILAVPLSIVLSSTNLGQALARVGLLVTPAETVPPPELCRLDELLVALGTTKTPDRRSLFDRLLTDPAFFALHQNILHATDSNVSMDPRQVRRITSRAVRRMSRDDRRAIQSDAATLAELHVARWLAQPVNDGIPH